MNYNQFNRDQWVRSCLAALPSGTRLLDVAAGMGRYRADCAHLFYESHDFCKVPDVDAKGKPYDKHTYVSDVTAIPAPDASYDAILCTEALEHFSEPIKAVFEISRLLRPGGLLLLSAPLGCGLHQEPYHFYGGFTPYWYDRFLSEADFTNIVVEPAKGFFFLQAQECDRAEAFLRAGRYCRPFAILLWPFLGPLLRLLALVFRRIDSVSQRPLYTIGYHVKATKKDPA